MESVKKQLVNYLVKAIFIFVGGLLVSRNVMSQQTLDYLANSVVAQLVAIIVVVAPLVFQYFNAQTVEKIQNETIKEAVNSEPGTPISVVKQRVLNTIRGEN